MHNKIRPVPIVNAVAKLHLLPGCTNPYCMLADDGRRYAVKLASNHYGARILINEYLAARIAQQIGLTVPGIALVRVPPELGSPGIHFGSRMIDGAFVCDNHAHLSREVWRSVINLHELAGAYVFDTWVANADFRQVLFAPIAPAGRLRLYCIDHGHCLGGCRWRFSAAPTAPARWLDGAYSEAGTTVDVGPWIEKIEELDPSQLARAVDGMPPQWLAEADASAFRAMVGALFNRRTAVRGLVSQFLATGFSPLRHRASPGRNAAGTQTPPTARAERQHRGTRRAAHAALIAAFALIGLRVAAQGIPMSSLAGLHGGKLIRKSLTPKQMRAWRKAGLKKLKSQFDRFYDLAKKGDGSAELAIGKAYEAGVGVPSDPATAVTWLRLAEASGSAAASYELGRIYGAGRGVAKNVPYAVNEYTEAAKSGYLPADYELGTLYESGNDIGGPDFTEAASWFRKAADSGNSESALRLAELYAGGKGVNKDPAEAAHWYSTAAKEGNATAKMRLGEIYQMGSGVPKDAAGAIPLLLAAAEAGLPEAEFHLGIMVEKGEGVPQNFTTAYVLLSLAQASGYAGAEPELAKLAPRMGGGMLEKAQSLAATLWHGTLER